MSINIATTITTMDVDAAPPPSATGGTLKRCSSAPMINENNTVTMTTSPSSPSSSSSSTREQSFNIFGPNEQHTSRTRRYSTSFSPIHGSPSTGVRLTPRISQLRQEECPDISNMRELAHEREIHHTIQISQSWEDLRLVSSSSSSSTNDNDRKKMGPLHVTLPPYNLLNYNSPSPPTRLNSPNFQSPTRASRTFLRRSASPVLRPSTLGGGAKRKLDDDNRLSPCTKRFHSNNVANDKLIGGLLTTSRTTTTSSPIPGSLSSVGTPESLSSADSPNFNFRMLDSPSPNNNRNIQTSEPMIVVTKNNNDQDMCGESQLI